MDTIKDAQERSKNWPASYDQWIHGDVPLRGSERHDRTLSAKASAAGKTQPDKAARELTGPSSPKILFLDIENRPNLTYVWNVWKPNYNDAGLIEANEMVCFAAGWHGSEDIMFFSKYHDGKAVMLDSIWQLLDAADIVVHYYGKKHDIPHINKDLLVAGYQPPSPYKQIDLYDTIKHKFNFTYNSLDHVCKQLGLSGKSLGKPGFDNWIQLLSDDPEAWQFVMEYNIQDVITLKELYYKVRPWVSNHPNLSIYDGGRTCPKCNSENTQLRGWVYTNASKYRQIYCNDCGGWSRLAKRTSTSERRNPAD